MANPFLESLNTKLVTPKKLLIVDDNPRDCEAIQLSTSSFNCELFVSGTIDAAVQTLQGKEKSFFKALFLDVNMPTIGHSLSLYKFLAESYPQVKVIILSGVLDSTIMSRFNEIYYTLFAEKPKCFNEQFFEWLFGYVGVEKRIPIIGKTGGSDGTVGSSTNNSEIVTPASFLATKAYYNFLHDIKLNT